MALLSGVVGDISKRFSLLICCPKQRLDAEGVHIANGSKTIKPIFQSVEVSVSSQSHMFDISLKGSG